MKTRPILMNAFSVRAILAGRKLQTRRVVKPQPELGRPWGKSGWTVDPERMDLPAGLCPRGVVGEQLWVRETFGVYSEDKGANFYVYRADCDPDESGPPPAHRWTPSIFMPREASRMLLEIAGVRVERVQDITDLDAWHEGAWWWRYDDAVGPPLYVADGENRDCFAEMWDAISEKRGFGWKRNPWVWVVSFRRLPPKTNG